jgi:hypothetical protein
MAVLWSATNISSNFSGGGTLTATYNGNGSGGYALATQGYSSGYWYFEVELPLYTGSGSDQNRLVGWSATTGSISGGGGSDTNCVGGNGYGQVNFNNNTLGNWTSGSLSGSNQYIAVAIDLTNLYFWINNLTVGQGWNDSGSVTPTVNNTGGGGYSFAGATNLPWYPAASDYGNSYTPNFIGNFLGSFQGTVPTGFSPVDAGGGGGGGGTVGGYFYYRNSKRRRRGRI